MLKNQTHRDLSQIWLSW